MTTGLYGWGFFIGVLGVEMAALVLLSELAGRFIQAPQRRICWQAALMASTLILAADGFGLNARTPLRTHGQPGKRELIVTVTDAIATHKATESSQPANTANKPGVCATWPAWVLLSGSMMLLTIGAVSRIYLINERRKMTSASAHIVSMAEPLLESLGVARVRICLWSRTGGPVAFGIWHPTVALPCDFEERFTHKQQQVMLAHELAHLAVYDPFWFAGMDIFSALMWWHPLAWWMRRRFRQCCEAAADEASALIPEGRTSLAESLVAFGRQLSLSGLSGGLGVAGSGIRSDLGLRVKALLTHSKPWQKLPARWRWGSRLAAIVCACALAASPIHADNPALLLYAKAESQPSTSPPAVAPELAADTAQPASEPQRAQITLSVAFTEISEKDAAISTKLDAMFDSAVNDTETASVDLSTFYPKLKLPSQKNVTVELTRTERQAAILGSEAFAALKEAIAKETDADFLTAPKVTMETGRQAHVAVQNTGAAAPGASPKPAGQVEYLAADGSKYTMTADAQVISYPFSMNGWPVQRQDLVNEPEFLMDAGRQAHVASQVMKGIVFDVQTMNGTPSHPTSSIHYDEAEVPVGVMADIVSKLGDDGLRLNVLAREVEFLGYDDPGSSVVQASGWADGMLLSTPVKGVLPRPHFRARECYSSSLVKPGQTILIRGPLAADTLEKKGDYLRAIHGQAATHRLFVFVTLESIAH